MYEAYDAPLDRVVALKVLPQEFLHDDSFAKRFQREARVVASLEHPHIVPIYANGIEDGVPWMSMRLVAGGSLADVIKRSRPGPARCSRILHGIAAALDHAHAHGVVHRDIKPSNVLLDDSDHAWVCDFGLAQLMQQSLALTRTGVVIGTPRYMSPEQVLGQEIDITSDIYSLGIVAYEMLTGAPPFDADSPVALLMKHVNERVPTPAGDALPGTALSGTEKSARQESHRPLSISQRVRRGARHQPGSDAGGARVRACGDCRVHRGGRCRHLAAASGAGGRTACPGAHLGDGTGTSRVTRHDVGDTGHAGERRDGVTRGCPGACAATTRG